MAKYEFQCRICGKRNYEEPQSIFEQPEGKLLRHIEQLTGVVLKNSKYLPQHICSECFMDLRQARAFRRRCLKTQNYFTTPEYKRIVRKEFEEKNKRQQGNRKAVQVVQDNDVGTTTTIDTQHYNDSMEATESEFLHDEKAAVGYENDDHLSHENPVILDVKVALAPTKEHEIVEFEFTKCEEGTSNVVPSSLIESTDLSKFVRTEIGNYNKGIQRAVKKRSITKYVCEQCGNIYDNVNAFHTHLNRHAGIKPFQCGNCPSIFYTKSELKLHTLSHTGERPFECKYCGRCFSSSGARLVHERLHTNERPYKCTYCTKAFRRLRTLKNHVLTHTKERKFECTVCNKYFQRRTHLEAHNRSQFHKINVEKLENLNEVTYQVISIEQHGQML